MILFPQKESNDEVGWNQEPGHALAGHLADRHGCAGVRPHKLRPHGSCIGRARHRCRCFDPTRSLRRREMRRTPLITIGVVLILIGAAVLVWPKVTYTERETVVEVGPVNITADTKKTVPLPPILGGIAMAGGVVLVIVGAKKS